MTTHAGLGAAARGECLSVFTVNRQPSAQDLRRFGWSMLIGFGVLGAVVWLAPAWRAGEASVWTCSGSGRQIAAAVLWLVGVVLGVIGLAAPRAVARAVYVAWMSVTVPVGVFMSTMLLAGVYFIALPVFALIARRSDPLRRRWRREGSYWEDARPHEPTLARARRSF